MIDHNTIKKAINEASIDVDLDNVDIEELSFSDLGFDSLDTYNFFLEMETLTGISVDDDEIMKLKDVKSIVNHFNQV